MQNPWTLGQVVGVVALYSAVLAVESRWPLRMATQPKFPRLIRNLTLGAIGSLAFRFGLYSAVLALAATWREHGWGVLGWLPAGSVLRLVAGILVLDYSLYLWHRANHRFSFLWRFHSVHHVYIDMDITTGARFHIGELAVSNIIRALVIVVAGVEPLSIAVFDTMAVVAVHFHHGNIRLPRALDHFLNRFIVTPRMHGLHHSIVRGETDSNYSTILCAWDRLHRTFTAEVPDGTVTIGLPGYRNPADIGLIRGLLMPLRRPRPWKLPDGSVPNRDQRGAPISLSDQL